MKRPNIINEKLIDSIICVAYGDASIPEKIKVYFYSLKDFRVKELLEGHRQTAAGVHSFRDQGCPDEIIKSANKKIQNEESKKNKEFKYPGFRFARPMIAAAASLIIIAVISLFILNKQPQEKRYSKAELIKAEEQVKQSLAIVGRVFRKTENRLTEDILEKQVTPPIKKSYDTINNILSGG